MVGYLTSDPFMPKALTSHQVIITSGKTIANASAEPVKSITEMGGQKALIQGPFQSYPLKIKPLSWHIRCADEEMPQLTPPETNQKLPTSTLDHMFRRELQNRCLDSKMLSRR